MSQTLLAPSNRHVVPSTAESFPEPRPVSPEKLEVPEIKRVGKQSNWNTQDKKPPKFYCVLPKEINIHAQ
jgi:hypothetical protein